MNVSFRTAGADDADLLDALARVAFDPRYGEGWSGAQMAATLTQPRSWGEIAFLDEDAAGFSLLRAAADEVELLLVGVVPPARARGIGRTLVTRAGDDALRAGGRFMHLEMRENNEDARRLYEYFAFTPVGRRRAYYCGAGGERYDAITMQSSLPLQYAANRG